jgi:hypothetical protein
MGRAAGQAPAYQGISEQNPTGSSAIGRVGLVAAFDMSTRTADGWLRDFSPMGHHGEILGTRTSGGAWGNGLSFPSAADRVDLPETTAWALDGPLSVLLWFRLEALGLHQHILACDDKFAVWLTEGNLLRFVDTVGDGAMTREPLAAGRWYSVAGVFEGTKGDPLTFNNIRVFVDGARVSVDLVGQPSGRPVWNPGRLYKSDACFVGFESHQGEATHQKLRFGGVIDELLVFSRAVTDAEVAVHAARPR